MAQPAMTLQDYLHWLPAFQSGMQSGLQNRRMEQDRLETARRLAIDQQIQDRLTREADFRFQEAQQARQRALAQATGQLEAWEPAMGPLTLQDTQLRQTPEYMGARASETANRLSQEARDEAMLKRIQERNTLDDFQGEPRMWTDPNGDQWLLSANPRQAPIRIPKPLSGRQIKDEFGRPIPGLYDVGGRHVQVSRNSQSASDALLDEAYAGETQAAVAESQPQAQGQPPKTINFLEWAAKRRPTVKRKPLVRVPIGPEGTIPATSPGMSLAPTASGLVEFNPWMR